MSKDIEIGSVIPVLDKGFVRIVDVLGNDHRVVEAARVSYAQGTKKVRNDAQLISYLMRNAHTSPFEQCGITFHIKMPLFVARQWMRHRTAKVNEISARYSILAEEFYVPEAQSIATQSKENKQGRNKEAVDSEQAQNFLAKLEEGYEHSYDLYKGFLEEDIARELARVVLPLGIYTECFWHMDLHNLFHFLKLRLDAHAQYEIRVYANVLLQVVNALFPLCTEAFTRHQLEACTLSSQEKMLIREMITEHLAQLMRKAKEYGLSEKSIARMKEKFDL